MADALCRLMQEPAQASATGIMHLAPEKGLSYQVFACAVARAFGWSEADILADGDPPPPPPPGQVAARLDLRLDGSRARALTGVALRAPDAALGVDAARGGAVAPFA